MADHPPMQAMEDVRVTVTASAKVGCMMCNGKGWLQRRLDGPMWGSSGPVPCECLDPRPGHDIHPDKGA